MNSNSKNSENNMYHQFCSSPRFSPGLGINRNDMYPLSQSPFGYYTPATPTPSAISKYEEQKYTNALSEQQHATLLEQHRELTEQYKIDQKESKKTIAELELKIAEMELKINDQQEKVKHIGGKVENLKLGVKELGGMVEDHEKRLGLVEKGVADMGETKNMVQESKNIMEELRDHIQSGSQSNKRYEHRSAYEEEEDVIFEALAKVYIKIVSTYPSKKPEFYDAFIDIHKTKVTIREKSMSIFQWKHDMDEFKDWAKGKGFNGNLVQFSPHLKNYLRPRFIASFAKWVVKNGARLYDEQIINKRTHEIIKNFLGK